MANDYMQKWKGLAEFIEEATFGTTPTNPTMVWPGLVTKATPVAKPKVESKFYLRSDASTLYGAPTSDGVSGARKHIKVGEDIGYDLEIVPQAGTLQTLLKYVHGGTNATPMLVTDVLKSISIGEKTRSGDATNIYRTFKGMTAREATLMVPEDGAVSLKMGFDGIEYTASATDYIGSGWHAQESSAAALTSASIAQIGAGQYIAMRKSAASPTAWSSSLNIADAIKSLELRITNKLTRVKDLSNTTSTKTKAFVCNSRDYVVSLEISYDDIAASSTDNQFTLVDIRSLTPFDIQFAIDGYKYTLIGVRFPELPYDFGSDDIFGDKVTSLPATGFVESSAWAPAFSVTGA
jgi:hypothetical protein